MRAFRRNPFLGPLLVTVAGMALEACLPGAPESYSPAALAGLLVLVLIWRNTPAIRVTLAAAAWFFAGGLWLSLHPLPVAPPTNVEAGERVVLAGCVDSPVKRSSRRVQFLVALPEGFRAQAAVYLREGETAPAIAFGQPVVVEGRIRPPRNFRNPGSFDYERHLAREDVFWLVSSTGIENLRKPADGPASCGNRVLRVVFEVRGALLHRLQGRFGSGSSTETYLAAILFGDDSRLAEETMEQYRLTGVYHVLVISGQHIAILAGAMLLFCRLLPIPRWARFLLTVLCCWAYTLLAGFEVPAVRAACGVSLYLAGSLAYRHARPLNLLSLIALVFLAWDPRQLLDASFQLSFIAVFAIAGIAAPLQRRLFGEWPQIARRLADSGHDLRLLPWVAEWRVELRLIARTLGLVTRIRQGIWLALEGLTVHLLSALGSLLLISIVVQATLSPLLVGTFHRFSVAAPVANLALSPLLGVLVPIALLDTLVGLPFGAELLEALVAITNGTVAALSGIAPDLRTPSVPAPLMMLAALLAVIAAVETEPLSRRLSARERRGAHVDPVKRQVGWIGRWKAPAIVSASALALVFVLVDPFSAESSRGSLEITILDVGQGDSALLVTPSGKTILVDTGGLGAYASDSRMDIGEDVVAPYLWSRGIRKLDLLVLSHFDYDHAGGAGAILRIFRPEKLWIPPPPKEDELWKAISVAAAEGGSTIEIRRAGDELEVGGMAVRILHPDGALESQRVESPTSNEASIVMECRYGERSVLFTGDIGRAEELEMLTRGLLRQIDFLKVAHHGSRSSTGAEFLEAVRPRAAFVSAGWLNAYRHPHPDVLKRLQRFRTAVFRTDLDGATTFRSDGARWTHVPSGEP